MPTESYPNLSGLNPTASTLNKWICYIPMKTALGDAYPNLELQITQFYIPRIDINTTTVSYQGYSFQIPSAGVGNSGDKSLTIQYIIDDEWRNYSALHTWTSKYLNFGNTVDKNNQYAQLAKAGQFFIPVRVWLLTPFKKHIIDFHFENCWITRFGDINLDVASSNIIKHTFQLTYTDFTIETHGGGFTGEFSNSNNSSQNEDEGVNSENQNGTAG